MNSYDALIISDSILSIPGLLLFFFVCENIAQAEWSSSYINSASNSSHTLF